MQAGKRAVTPDKNVNNPEAMVVTKKEEVLMVASEVKVSKKVYKGR